MYEVLLHPDAQKVYVNADYYRYRIGDYRIIYSVDDKIVQVFVVAIAHRGEAYES